MNPAERGCWKRRVPVIVAEEPILRELCQQDPAKSPRSGSVGVDRAKMLQSQSRHNACVYTFEEAELYTKGCSGFNTTFVNRPDMVVIAKNEQDVVHAVKFAKQHGYKVHVQVTGHGNDVQIKDGILIQASVLNTVRVDAEKKLAYIGGGALMKNVMDACAPHGLSPLPGSSPYVGAVGYVLGGGIGAFVRQYGYTSDYVESFRVVIGSGELITANKQENNDLYWALRGGKKHLGVVVEMTLRVVEMKSIYGGSIMYTEEHIEAVMRAYVEWTKTADPRVSASFGVINFPPLPFIPAPLQGKRIAFIRIALPNGTTEEGESIIAPFLTVAPVMMNTMAVGEGHDVGRIWNEPNDPCNMWVCGRSVQKMDQEYASALIAEVTRPGSTTIMDLRFLGTHTHNIPEGGSPIAGRSAPFLNYFVGHAGTTTRDEVTPFFTKVSSHLSSDINPNFCGAAVDWETQFGSAATRLKEIRNKYDADHIFQ